MLEKRWQANCYFDSNSICRMEIKQVFKLEFACTNLEIPLEAATRGTTLLYAAVAIPFDTTNRSISRDSNVRKAKWSHGILSTSCRFQSGSHGFQGINRGLADGWAKHHSPGREGTTRVWNASPYMDSWKTFSAENCFATERFLAETFFGPKFFRPKRFSPENLFGRNFFDGKSFRWEKKIGRKKLSQKHFRWKKFSVEQFFGRNNFRSKNFSTKKCFGQKSCGRKKKSAENVFHVGRRVPHTNRPLSSRRVMLKWSFESESKTAGIQNSRFRIQNSYFGLWHSCFGETAGSVSRTIIVESETAMSKFTQKFLINRFAIRNSWCRVRTAIVECKKTVSNSKPAVVLKISLKTSTPHSLPLNTTFDIISASKLRTSFPNASVWWCGSWSSRRRPVFDCYFGALAGSLHCFGWMNRWMDKPVVALVGSFRSLISMDRWMDELIEGWI